MSMRKILVDDTNRELCPHGTESFPMTVSHDDLWDFEGKSVPIHWHNDLEISLPRKGESIYQIYQKSYHLNPGEGLKSKCASQLPFTGQSTSQIQHHSGPPGLYVRRLWK